ncbi:similar to Saccharomyces cerevisiae YDR349C YPS7 Putative GPI-anchored aspartic protease, member of the yapsin family of proteases involved in cell wall growth and maintenance [Maudiozyma saulgeensis]|uniref:Similar to Saccharomyces cerevisiae YDR349C YPS7 Putative GPI-anchored aspartic protease, member of the yapsin family of proteases involved in cell wall growth and maintenance n=1 Tax=Maudiozyma saulgeensis TaxID=1789683 RepID=A0A1X7R1Y1_9SACH|nr:similar to Saccharomyces cerevisiae YDR349C YPS7 Putative GPI-anchored aspartic protease, member of the yapsin family of proteases involved in cell wall growth and maintenance [Kazachstania saulgeensis]
MTKYNNFTISPRSFVLCMLTCIVSVSCLQLRNDKILTNVGSSTRQFPTVLVGKDNNNYYFINVTFGTPGQLQALALDTANPYSWVLSGEDDSQCGNHSNCDTTLYMRNESSSAIDINPGERYSLDFIEGIEVNGTVVSDVITFPNITILTDDGSKTAATFTKFIHNTTTNVTFSNNYLTISQPYFLNVNESNNLYSGVLGLGGLITYPGNAIDYRNFDNDEFYFMKSLVDANIIESASYSLWLNNDPTSVQTSMLGNLVNDNSGQLIFGAVDPLLFKNDLIQFDMIPFMDSDTGVASTGYPILPMGPVYITNVDKESLNMTSKDYLEPVLIDSSFIGSYLPVNTIIQIAIQIGATYVESVDRWLVRCDVGTVGAHIDFTFDDVTIKVPLQHLLSTTFDSSVNETVHFSDGQSACFLKLYANSYIGFNVLGESFLRNAYLVVDLEGSTVALAEANTPDDISSIVSSITSSKQSSTVSSKGVSTSSSTSGINTTIAAIQSGYIPFATHKTYNGSSLTLYPASVSSLSSNIPGQYTATIFSNGIVTAPARSFYDTSRTSSTTRSSSTQFNSLSINLSSAASTTISAAAIKGVEMPIVCSYVLDFSSSTLMATLVGLIALNMII